MTRGGTAQAIRGRLARVRDKPHQDQYCGGKDRGAENSGDNKVPGFDRYCVAFAGRLLADADEAREHGAQHAKKVDPRRVRIAGRWRIGIWHGGISAMVSRTVERSTLPHAARLTSEEGSGLRIRLRPGPVYGVQPPALLQR